MRTNIMPSRCEKRPFERKYQIVMLEIKINVISIEKAVKLTVRGDAINKVPKMRVKLARFEPRISPKASS